MFPILDIQYNSCVLYEHKIFISHEANERHDSLLANEEKKKTVTKVESE